jgi:hypothetical protein
MLIDRPTRGPLVLRQQALVSVREEDRPLLEKATLGSNALTCREARSLS